MSQIFISYDRADWSFVDRLVTSLTDHEHFVYLDRLEIRGGDVLTENIPRAVSEADFVLAVVTASSRDSVWVAFEIGIARAIEVAEPGRVKVVPICLGELKLPAYLEGRHAVLFAEDLSNYERGVEELLAAIGDDRNAPAPAIADVPASLVIFRTRTQTTRPCVEGGELRCYLDDARKGRGGLQWSMSLSQARVYRERGRVSVDERSAESKAGYLTIGPRTQWVYTKSLFAGPEDVVDQIGALLGP